MSVALENAVRRIERFRVSPVGNIAHLAVSISKILCGRNLFLVVLKLRCHIGAAEPEFSERHGSLIPFQLLASIDDTQPIIDIMVWIGSDVVQHRLVFAWALSTGLGRM